MKLEHLKQSKWLKAVAPLGVLIVSVLLAILLTSLRPEQEKKEPEPNYPKIEVYTVASEPIRLVVDAQGTVQPRQKTRLTARVSGHIEWVSPDFYEGGSFKKGDILLKLDTLPYESAFAEAKSRIALADSIRLQEQEAAAQARLDWQSVGQGEPSPLVLRKPQLDKALADLEAARIGLQMAEDNLSYTEIRAPYDGRVESKFVDVGQAITAQVSILGDIFSVEGMEIPLAISLDDLSIIQSPENGSAGNPGHTPVLLKSRIAGVEHTWEAYLDRMAASIDARTRMISAYARKEPPFTSDNGAILRPGMFVQAAIQGRLIEEAVRIPRGALQPGNIAYRVTDENRLEAINLEIVRTDANWAIITNGLVPGDRLCLTPLLFFVEGMNVALEDDPQSPSSVTPKPES